MKYRYGMARQPTYSLPFRYPDTFWVSRHDPFKLSLKSHYSFPLFFLSLALPHSVSVSSPNYETKLLMLTESCRT